MPSWIPLADSGSPELLILPVFKELYPAGYVQFQFLVTVRLLQQKTERLDGTTGICYAYLSAFYSVTFNRFIKAFVVTENPQVRLRDAPGTNRPAPDNRRIWENLIRFEALDAYFATPKPWRPRTYGRRP